MTIPRYRLGWGLLDRAGGLDRFLASEQLFPRVEQVPPDCLATWPALMFRTREAARSFVRARFGDRRPRVVRARAVVEQCKREELAP